MPMADQKCLYNLDQVLLVRGSYNRASLSNSRTGGIYGVHHHLLPCPIALSAEANHQWDMECIKGMPVQCMCGLVRGQGCLIVHVEEEQQEESREPGPCSYA